MDRDEALALLEANHSFPGRFSFRAVTRPADRTTVLTAVTAAGGERLVVERVTERASRNGTYVSLHIEAHVADAEIVLEVFAILHQLEEVVISI